MDIRLSKLSFDVECKFSASVFVAASAAAAETRMLFAVRPAWYPFTTTTPPSVSVFIAKSSMSAFFDPNPYKRSENSDCRSCHHLE